MRERERKQQKLKKKLSLFSLTVGQVQHRPLHPDDVVPPLDGLEALQAHLQELARLPAPRFFALTRQQPLLGPLVHRRRRLDEVDDRADPQEQLLADAPDPGAAVRGGQKEIFCSRRRSTRAAGGLGGVKPLRPERRPQERAALSDVCAGDVAVAPQDAVVAGLLPVPVGHRLAVPLLVLVSGLDGGPEFGGVAVGFLSGGLGGVRVFLIGRRGEVVEVESFFKARASERRRPAGRTIALPMQSHFSFVPRLEHA